MDTIRYLLGKIVKLVVIIFALVFVFTLANLLFPGFKLSKSIDFSFFNMDWIPTPKNRVKGTAQPDGNTVYGNIYQPGEPFNGYNTEPNRYITYSYNGNMPTSTLQQPFSGGATPYGERARYIRNVSLYEGGDIRYGETIYGDANAAMFRNGIFQIVILDSMGRPISSMYAMNLGTWSVPGWLHWKAVIQTPLPSNTSCTLVFLSGDGARISIPVRCK